MKKWLIFVSERFHPISHILMISCFVLAHISVDPDFTREAGFSLFSEKFPLLMIGTTFFFFKLRLFDEIKDFKLDCIINPQRPLVRGLVTRANLNNGITFCVMAEVFSFSLLGTNSTIAFAIPFIYSFLMFKEFFIPKIIGPHLTTYALSHTIVSGFLSVAIFSALTDKQPWQLEPKYYLFALASWCLFNIFEFGRKTFAKSEEREGVESYSKVFGTYGAVILVLVMAAVALCPFWYFDENFIFRVFSAGAVGLLTLSGLAFCISGSKAFASFYRGFSSGFIVLFYSAFVISRHLKF